MGITFLDSDTKLSVPYDRIEITQISEGRVAAKFYLGDKWCFSIEAAMSFALGQTLIIDTAKN